MQMEILQKTTVEDYRGAFAAHFRRHQNVRFRPLIALLNVAFGIYLLTILSDSSRYLGLLLIVMGVYIMLVTKIHVWRSLKMMRTSKLYEKPMRIEISESGIQTEIGDSHGRFAFVDLLGFYPFSEGILIYVQKNQFLPIFSRHLNAPLEIGQISNRLKEAGLPSLCADPRA